MRDPRPRPPRPSKRPPPRPDDRGGPRPVPPPKPRPVVDHHHGAGNPAAPKPSPEIISRQRFLRAHGYAIAVDGIWGPASQRAWDAYQRSLHPPRPDDRAGPRPKPIVQRARATAAQLHAQSRIRTQLLALRREAARVLPPGGPIPRLMLHGHLERAILPAALRAEQHQREMTRLRHDAVITEGRRAIHFAEAARKKTPEQMTARDLVAVTVDPLTGRFDPQRPADVKLVQRYLRAHGHPHLTVDGAYSRETNAALLAALNKEATAERHAQQHELVDTVYHTGIVVPGRPFSVLQHAPRPGELLTILQRGGFTASILYRDLVERAFSPDARFLLWRDQQLDQLERSFFGPFATTFDHPSARQRALRLALAAQPGGDSAKIGDTAAAQILALAGTRDPAQFQRRLEQIKARDEADYRGEQARRARHRAWWQKSLDVASYPGQWFRSEIATNVERLHDLATDPIGFATGDRTEDEARQRALLWQAQFAKDHTILNLGWEIVADPLNFIPYGAVARATALGALRAESLGYALVRGAELFPIAKLRPAAVLLAHAGTLPLIAPADAGRIARLTWMAKGDLVPARVAHYAHLAGRAKNLTMAVTRQTILQAVRHGFASRTLRDGTKLETYRFDADALADLERTRTAHAAETQGFVPGIINALRDTGQAIWSHESRRQLSRIGGMLTGRLYVALAYDHLDRFALEASRSRFLAHLGLEDGGDEAAAALARPAAHPEALDAARAEHADILARGDGYHVGVGDTEIAAELAPRLNRSMDALLRAVFPSIQGHLEGAAELGLRDLFDDAGRLIENNGAVVDAMKRLGLDLFDERQLVRVANPRYGKFFTHEQMDEMIEREIAYQERRLTSYASREAAAGRALPRDWVDDQLEAVRRDVSSHWRHVAGQGWTDDREFIEAPAAYLRRAGASAVSGTAADGGRLAPIAMAPGDAAGTPLDSTIQSLSWALARRGYHGELGRALDSRDLSGSLRLGSFRDATYQRLESLDRAYDIALPQQMLREFAVWQALANAQSAPLKAAYTGLNGMLSIWLVATLPLRPAFAVRNVVDNTAKMLTAGARDPRFYFYEYGKSIFDLNLRAMRYILSLGHHYNGNPAVLYFDRLVDTFWQHSEPVIARIFAAHGVPVPESIIARMKNVSVDAGGDDALSRFRDWIWEVMAVGPENASKRILYRDTYYKAIERGATEDDAALAAIGKVEHTLFDYDQLTTLEDNLRFIFPFAFFWRKTTKFWITEAIKQPWLPYEFTKFEEGLRNDVHRDWPEWMRRYVAANPALDLAAAVPGLSYITAPLANVDALTDPANYLSFNVLYRTFKGENPNLPPDKAGIRFLSDFADAINDWGLSLNPFVRKPLELTGVLNFRAWQNVFPETDLLQAFTRKFLSERFPNGLNIEAWLEDATLEALGSDFSVSDKLANNFDQYVSLEMAAQAARGETVDAARARKKMQDFFLVQSLVGFIAGAYLRYNDPGAFHLYKLAEMLGEGQLELAGLSERDRRAYLAFTHRKLNPLQLQRYLEAAPLVHAYYLIHDPEKAEAFKQQHPEIVQYVDPAWKAHVYSDNFVRDSLLVIDTGAALQMYQLTDDLDLPRDVRDLAERSLATPRLKAFWRQNDTPREQRDKMLRGLYFQYLLRLQQAFFSIPETDYAARKSYLDAHPILQHFWDQNNDASDDLKAIINSSNAALRDRYFEFVDGDDWDGAHAFLRRFPFIFEFTKAADRVSPDGEWIGGHPHSQHAQDYLRAKPWLDYYFSLGKSGRSAWLNSGAPGSDIVKWYFGKWAHHGAHTLTQHAADYLRAKSWLDHYFSLAEGARSSWLNSGAPGSDVVKWYFGKYASGGRHGLTQHAKDYLAARHDLNIFFALLKQGREGAYDWLRSDKGASVRAYFSKYAHHRGTSQHAIDYLGARTALDHYFGLLDKDRASARDWLHAGSPDAEAVLAYFKKYGKLAKYARKWGFKHGEIKSSDPEVNSRLAFWSRYWQLAPADRPQFVIDHAEQYHVFVYGPLGEQERRDKMARYLREALGRGLDHRAALYLRIAPLLELFFKLNKDQRSLFLRANPDVQAYLDQYATGVASGHKQLDKLVERYFSLPEDSDERTALLRQHPELQRYFDSKQSPAARAMHRLLQVYFTLPAAERKRFLALHPEIQAYFDKRHTERHNERAAEGVFDLADPRLASYREEALREIVTPAKTLAESLRRRRASDIDLSRRTHRSPTDR